jgi:hypothetical protein
MTNLRTGLFLALVALPVAISAAPPATYKTPRTESGQPDLRGVWNYSSDVPLERPAAFADRTRFTREEIEAQRQALEQAFRAIATIAPVEDVSLSWLDHQVRVDDLRTSLITHPDDGKIPPLAEGVRRFPGARELIAALADPKNTSPAAFASLLAPGVKNGPEDFSSSERCLFAASTPFVPELDGNYVQLLQSADHVVLLTDATRRIVPLNGSPHVADTQRSWSGDSRGHWEGDTLVIETKNFNGRTRSFAGAGSARDKVVVERFTRRDADTLDYEATILDPKSFTDRIVLTFPMARVESRVYETACHEHNYSLANSLSAARAEERAAAGR